MPEMRGQGIGSLLLDAVEARLHELGIEDMLIGVITTNTEAMRLCERRGAMPFLTQSDDACQNASARTPRESAHAQAAAAIPAETSSTAGQAPIASARRCEMTNASRPTPRSRNAVRVPWRCIQTQPQQSPPIARTTPPSAREPVLTAMA